MPARCTALSARNISVEDGHHDPYGRALAYVEDFAEVLAHHEFHGERELPVAFFPQGVGNDDGGMVQVGEDGRLLLEAEDEGILVEELRDHLLHDDHAVERFIVAEPHVAHRAVPEHLRRRVAADFLRQCVLCLFRHSHLLGPTSCRSGKSCGASSWGRDSGSRGCSAARAIPCGGALRSGSSSKPGWR